MRCVCCGTGEGGLSSVSCGTAGLASQESPFLWNETINSAVVLLGSAVCVGVCERDLVLVVRAPWTLWAVF